MINTLRSSDKNEMKLAERLNNLYDATVSKNKVLDIASVQQEIRSFGEPSKRTVNRPSRAMGVEENTETKILITRTMMEIKKIG